jgi:hypothetical protein
MAWLDDHPPARSQFRCPRRAQPSGVIVVHTAENTPDFVAFDGGAEGVANFVRTRDTPGSYHDICDSDSTINLVRYDCEAYHDGTGSNPHSYGVSGATRADVWPLAPQAWKDGCVRNMALAARRYADWLHARSGIVIPARRITREQSEARVPGFISHAERDPARRTDPGQSYPWDMFFDIYSDTGEGDWLDMATEAEVRAIVADECNRVIRQVTGNKALIVAFDDISPGDPDHWFSVPAQTRSEVTRPEAEQAVAQGTARWWDPDVAEPKRVPRATLESVPLVE